MDLSSTAIEAANAFLATSSNPPRTVSLCARRFPSFAQKTDVPFRSQAGDFFTFPLPSPLFTLAYDYTFFCALPPSLRAAWAARYAELIQPGGVLIALVYPIGMPFSFPLIFAATLMSV